MLPPPLFHKESGYAEMITDKEKIKMYEALLHDIQMCREVSMNGERLNTLLDNICRWSYAHRVGNGMISEERQQEIVDVAFEKLRS